MRAADETAVGREDGGTRAVRLRIPAREEYVALSRLALAGLAELRAIGDDTTVDLKLALTEAVSNAVRHAYGPAGEGTVEIRFVLHPGRIGIEVLDDGAGFDPAAGGLGLAIIRTLADELQIDSPPGGRGSRLRFAKNLDELPAPGAA